MAGKKIVPCHVQKEILSLRGTGERMKGSPSPVKLHYKVPSHTKVCDFDLLMSSAGAHAAVCSPTINTPGKGEPPQTPLGHPWMWHR